MTIDGFSSRCPWAGILLIRAAEQVARIPRFCDHHLLLCTVGQLPPVPGGGGHAQASDGVVRLHACPSPSSSCAMTAKAEV